MTFKLRLVKLSANESRRYESARYIKLFPDKIIADEKNLTFYTYEKNFLRYDRKQS